MSGQCSVDSLRTAENHLLYHKATCGREENPVVFPEDFSLHFSTTNPPGGGTQDGCVRGGFHCLYIESLPIFDVALASSILSGLGGAQRGFSPDPEMK